MIHAADLEIYNKIHDAFVKKVLTYQKLQQKTINMQLTKFNDSGYLYVYSTKNTDCEKMIMVAENGTAVLLYLKELDRLEGPFIIEAQQLTAGENVVASYLLKPKKKSSGTPFYITVKRHDVNKSLYTPIVNVADLMYI